MPVLKYTYLLRLKKYDKFINNLIFIEDMNEHLRFKNHKPQANVINS